MATKAWIVNLKKAVIAELKGAAIVSSRVHSGRPRKPTLPYIVVHTALSSREEYGLGFNAPASRMVRIQVDGIATTQSGADELMDAIQVALDGAVITVAGWGSPRLEGYWGPTTMEEWDKDVLHWRNIKRYRLLLAGENIS